MGGNIFVASRRYSKKEYHELVAIVTEMFKDELPHMRFEIIPTYHQKESFGDMDIIVDNLYRQRVRQLFTIKDTTFPMCVSNGNVDSVLFRDFQIDLIFTAPDDIDAALNYFSWGDLGNLCGRVIHKTGFKYGHLGLMCLIKEGHYQFSEILVSRDMKLIMSFVEYDYDTWKQGFDTQEDIFRFVSSTPYFNKNIFLLHNRSHTSRIRDRKRKMYREFLNWIDSRDLPEYPWKSLEERGGYVQQPEWLQKAFEWFPEFEETYRFVRANFEQQILFKKKYNGNLVRDVTQLSGIELGRFMQYLNDSSHYNDGLKEFVLASTEEQIRNWVDYCFHHLWKF
jgi:hypothetical protein